MSAPARLIVEQGPNRPPTVAELLSLVARLTPEVKRITAPLGWHYRKPLVQEAEGALDAAVRFGLMPRPR